MIAKRILIMILRKLRKKRLWKQDKTKTYLRMINTLKMKHWLRKLLRLKRISVFNKNKLRSGILKRLIIMERERLRPNQDMDMAAMEDMVMGDLMEVMVDTEAMEVMVMEREMLSQVMDMVDMVMERERLRPNQDMDMA